MSQNIIMNNDVEQNKTLAWWLYLAHAASFLFSLGALSILPLIVNYLKRGDAAGTFVYSHHSWQIRSFWWYLVWVAVGAVLWVTLIGIPLAILVWGVVWIWKAYRLIKGFIDLNANQEMPL